MLTPRQRLSHKLRDGKYRARLAGCQADTIPVADALFFLDIDKCFYCEREIPEDTLWTLEHKIPLKCGGAHTLSNLAKSCAWCNDIKHTLTDEEFQAWQTLPLDLRGTTEYIPNPSWGPH